MKTDLFQSLSVSFPVSDAILLNSYFFFQLSFSDDSFFISEVSCICFTFSLEVVTFNSLLCPRVNYYLSTLCF